MGTLRDWWSRFDRFGRRFITRANPILGHREQAILSDLQRKKEAEAERKVG